MLLRFNFVLSSFDGHVQAMVGAQHVVLVYIEVCANQVDMVPQVFIDNLWCMSLIWLWERFKFVLLILIIMSNEVDKVIVLGMSIGVSTASKS